MAQKNIVVADAGIKLALYPNAKDRGTALTLDAEASNAIRKHVRKYVQADARELPYDERLTANKRVGLKGNNGMVPVIRAIIKDFKERNTAPTSERKNTGGKATSKPKAAKKHEDATPKVTREYKQAAIAANLAKDQAEAEARNAEINAALDTLRRLRVL